jgi:hypothetical protein
MEYKGYKIYGCIMRDERWTLDSSGELTDFYQDCPQHDNGPVVYEVCDDNDNHLIAMGSLEGAKGWADRRSDARGAA